MAKGRGFPGPEKAFRQRDAGARQVFTAIRPEGIKQGSDNLCSEEILVVLPCRSLGMVFSTI